MLTFVLRKMLSNKWMVVCLLIGNIFLCSVVASVPTYSDAILNRVLTKQLQSMEQTDGIYPGLVSFTQEVRTPDTNSRRAEAQQAIGDVIDQMDMDVSGHQVMRRSFAAELEILTNRKPKTKFQRVNLYSFNDMTDHVTLVSGHLPAESLEDGTVEVIINERTMDEEDMLLNEEYEIKTYKSLSGEPYRIRVVGIFRSPENSEDLFWTESPENISEMAIISETAFDEMFTDAFNIEARYTVIYNYFLDYTQMDSKKVTEYAAIAENCREPLKDNYSVTETGFRFLGTTTDFDSYSSRLNITLWVLLVPIFVLLAFFIYMVSGKILEEDKNTIAVIKSRGASRWQVIGIFTIQSIFLAFISVLISIPLGMAICKMIGSANGFLELVQRTSLKVRLTGEAVIFTALAGAISVLTMVIPAISYSGVSILDHKRASTGDGRKKTVTLISLAVALLGISVYGLYSFNNQIQFIMAAEGGASMDPLLFLSSALFIISLGVLAAVLIPAILRGVYLLGKKRWSPTLFMTFLRAIRAVDGQRSIMIFMVLTVAIGIFNAKMARTINQNNEDNISYTNGSAIVLQEKWANNEGDKNASQLVYIEPDYGKYDNLVNENPGLIATKVMNGKGYSVGTLGDVRFMGIDVEGFSQTAWMRDDLLPIHWYNYLNALTMNSSAVLVSENFQDLGYKLGDEILVTDANKENYKGIIYGFVDYWPTYFATDTSLDAFDRTVITDNYLVVGNLTQIQSTLGMKPYEIWIQTENPSAVYSFAEEYGVTFRTFVDTAGDIVDMKNDPVLQGTNGVLTVGFIIVLLVCMTGFLIYWILSIRARALQFGVLRAMGMSMGSVIGMLVSEQLFITFTSIGAGIFVGWISSDLFVPVIQMSFRSTDASLPLHIVSNTGDFIRLFSIIALVIVVCLIVLIGLIRKIKVAQALKLGEE